MILETLQLALASGESGEWGRVCLVHFINETLDFRFRISEKLEQRGDAREEPYKPLSLCFDIQVQG